VDDGYQEGWVDSRDFSALSGEWALGCESADQRFELSFGMPKKLFSIWARSEIVLRDKGRRSCLI
jgi:hypothetical protein